jgi:hypothetical protein
MYIFYMLLILNNLLLNINKKIKNSMYYMSDLGEQWEQLILSICIYLCFVL